MTLRFSLCNSFTCFINLNPKLNHGFNRMNWSAEADHCTKFLFADCCPDRLIQKFELIWSLEKGKENAGQEIKYSNLGNVASIPNFDSDTLHVRHLCLFVRCWLVSFIYASTFLVFHISACNWIYLFFIIYDQSLKIFGSSIWLGWNSLTGHSSCEFEWGCNYICRNSSLLWLWSLTSMS